MLSLNGAPDSFPGKGSGCAGAYVYRHVSWSPGFLSGESRLIRHAVRGQPRVSMEPRIPIRGKDQPRCEKLLMWYKSQWSPVFLSGERARAPSSCAARVSSTLFERCLFQTRSRSIQSKRDLAKPLSSEGLKAASDAACASRTEPLALWK